MTGHARTIRRSRSALAVCLLVASSAGYAAAPAGRYSVDAAAGVVTDNATGLVWQRCASGKSGPDCATGTLSFYTQSDAASYCSSLSLGGWSSGWRLPTVKELQSLVDIRATSPAIDTAAFPTPSTDFWSSSPEFGRASYAWVVDFASGWTLPQLIGATDLVRCVR